MAGARARFCGSECAGYITGRMPSCFSLAFIVIAATCSNSVMTLSRNRDPFLDRSSHSVMARSVFRLPATVIPGRVGFCLLISI